MIRCVGFDFDGTLVDSNAIKRRAFFDVLAHVDPDGETVAHVLDVVQPGDRFDIMRELARRLGDRGTHSATGDAGELAADWADAYTRRCEEAVSQCAEIPGASAALDWLGARRLPLYVNSATPEAALKRVLDLRSLTPHFRLCLGRPADKHENLATICADARAAPRELLFVGDGEDDRRAALEFGCRFSAVVRPGPSRFDEPPECCIGDLHELPALIERQQEEAT